MKSSQDIARARSASGLTALTLYLRDVRRARDRVQLPERAHEILRAADRVLLGGGIAELSLRRVAESAGYSLATVQHYFPLKADLIRELMEVRVDWYQDQLSKIVSDLPDDPQLAFDQVVGWFVKDVATPEQGSWWFHFWALAAHDPNARETLDRAMLLYRQTLAVVVSGVNPSLSSIEALTRAALLTCMIEGSLLLLAEDKPRHTEVEGLPDALMRFARSTAFAEP